MHRSAATLLLSVTVIVLSSPSGALAQVTAKVPAPSSQALIEDEKNTVDVFEAVGPATAFVTQNRTRMVRSGFRIMPLEVPGGTGSGIVWDKKGHIVTNFHVVDGAKSLTVTLYNQKTYPAKVVGGERRKDIAVIKVDAPRSVLRAIRLPPRGHRFRVGQKTLAVGNPFGLDHTLTTGVISALDRELRGYGGVTITGMVQTDASINPGNSGGPLVDSRGQLIGMNTTIISKSGSSAGIGFAVPVATMRRIVPQLIAKGHVENVGIGVSLVPDDVAGRVGIRGVIVRAVLKGGPAAKAGIRGLSESRRGVSLGDVIVGLDGKKIETYDDLYTALDGRAAGERVEVKLSRGDKTLKKHLKLIRLK